MLSSDFEIPGYTYGYLLEPEEGYKLKEGTMSVKAGDDTVSYLNSNGTYSFTMPDSDVHISAEFEKEPPRKAPSPLAEPLHRSVILLHSLFQP